MTGTIFNILRFAVNDGPGIRTTVFFKGCPLHCRWCHNPESISPDKEMTLFPDRCLGCGDCAAICTRGAIQESEGGYVYHRESCVQCGSCVEICAANARQLTGRVVSVNEVMQEIEKDIPFYDESGGGVTCSGGEPLLQHEFLIELLKACKDRSLHTAVDTTGFTSRSILAAVSEHTDLFLYDLKTMDAAKHLEFTGVSNITILENLRYLASQGRSIVLRMPVIPGFNDDAAQLEAAALFASSLGTIREFQLLPYHTAGENKYRRLGLTYPLAGTLEPSIEHMQRIAGEIGRFFPAVAIER